ncbi:MAG: hypothetical protein AAGN35_21235 [Bacteroidota bacterium]
MKDKLFLLLLLPCFFGFHSHLLAQTFQHAYGASALDEGAGIAPASNGSYAIGGATESFTLTHLETTVMVVDSAGNLQWARYSGTSNSDEEVTGIAVSGNGVFAAGGTDDPGPGQVNGFLQKYDLNTGNLLATRSTGIAQFAQINDLDVAPNGQLYATGFSFQNATDIFVTKWDTNLNLLWGRTIGSSNDAELAFDALATSDGGLLVLGITSLGLGGDDIVIHKLDSSGNSQWNRIYGTPNTDILTDAIEIPNGYILVGQSNINNNDDAIVLRIDTSGTLIWARSYGGGSDDDAFGIENVSGNYVVCGNTGSFGQGSRDGYILQLDTNGNVLSANAYGSTGDEFLLDLTIDPAGFLIGLGFTTSFGAGSDDIYLLKASPNGFVGCNDSSFAMPSAVFSLTPTTATFATASAGTTLTRTWASTNAPFQINSLCGPPPCSVTAAATLSGDTLCAGDTLIVTDVSTGNTTRTWLINGMPLTGNLNPFPIVQLASGQFTLSIIASNGNCSDTTDYVYNVFPAPTFNRSSDTLCDGDVLQVFNTTPGASGATWFLNGSNVASGLSA